MLPYPGAVSLQAIRDRAAVERGQSMLIVGASGAVGTIALQIAKAFGAYVTAVCGRRSTDLVRALGADHAIDYSHEDFTGGGDLYDTILDIGGNTPLARLRKALDPRAVDAFLRVLPRVREEAEESGKTMLAPRGATKSSVFDDIAVAHGEIHALYQIAQTMGTSLGVSDSMEHIASKLTSLVPFSACTLFLFDQANPCTQGVDPGDTFPDANKSGIVFFPGSTPLYKDGQLVAGFGVSGDGVAQDDVVTSAGGISYLPQESARADTILIRGVRLPYFKFNRNPEQ